MSFSLRLLLTLMQELPILKAHGCLPLENHWTDVVPMDL